MNEYDKVYLNNGMFFYKSEYLKMKRFEDALKLKAINIHLKNLAKPPNSKHD